MFTFLNELDLLNSILHQSIQFQMSKKSRATKKRIIDTSIADQSNELAQTGVKYRSIQLRKVQTLDILNGTNMPSKFKFREKETEKIKAFLQACVKKQLKGFKFLMITGSPGAGKSLCANSILSKIDCQVIKLNANMVKTIGEVQTIISQKLLDNDSNRTALQIIRELQEREYNKTCVIYIQEIQILFKAAPNAISEDFLTLFHKKNLSLILIGISNRIDTLQKYSSQFSFKVQQIQNVVFSPYTVEHIIQIIKDKLQFIKAKTDISIQFPEKLLKFASQKLQTLKKGDFRICLQFLKQVVKMSFNKSQKQQQDFSIGIAEINAIFNKMNISKNDLMAILPYQQQVTLIALYSIIKKTDVLKITLKQLQSQLKWVCGSLQINYSKQLMEDGMRELQQYSLIEVKKKINQTSIILKVSIDDISTTYSQHFVFKKFFTSESL